ncbi:hypothetical protein [Clostridium butyricum]|uniref:hypothetical protein n=1 Tax=Clostridium butyricum TaxID=1492 RepID=UPI0032C09753
MKLKYTSDDFYISTTGLEILKKIMYYNITIIAIAALIICYYEYEHTLVTKSALPQILMTLLISFVIALPSIVVCLLVKMIMGWTYNVKEQSKIQFNISNNTEDIKDTLKKLLEMHQSEINLKE